jgi:hypothetical protein
MLIGGGISAQYPADGLSFSFASDLPPLPSYTVPGEEGAGSGLIVSFDTFPNGSTDAVAIDVFFNGVLKGRNLMQSSQGPTGNSFFDVFINLKADGSLDLTYNAQSIFTALPTNYAPISGGRYAFGARTGGFTDNHWIDDLSITTSTQTPVPDPGSTLLLFGMGLVGLRAWRKRWQ